MCLLKLNNADPFERYQKNARKSILTGTLELIERIEINEKYRKRQFTLNLNVKRKLNTKFDPLVQFQSEKQTSMNQN